MKQHPLSKFIIRSIASFFLVGNISDAKEQFQEVTMLSPVARDIYNLDLIYNSDYQYPLPQKVLESFLSEKAFDNKENYTEVGPENLRKDINELYQRIISASPFVIRAAIDIGSGGPKIRIAEVDLTLNKIIRVLHVEQYPVIFQESLSRGSDRTLNTEIMLQGIQAIKDAVSLASSFKAEGIVMIGTSVFRNAVNGEQYAKTIHSEIGLPVRILDQELEGKLAFQAVLARTSINSEDLVVWDIGGGSTQFVGINKESYLIDGSNEGSGPFRDFIIESIQRHDPKEYRSPNPISQEHADLAEAYASDLALKVDQVFRDKLRESEVKVVGVGSVFGRGIASLMLGKNPVTIQELKVVVQKLVGKSDSDLGGSSFACIEVSNALLALGFMKGLGINQINIIDVNNADGAMVYKPFWE